MSRKIIKISSSDTWNRDVDRRGMREWMRKRENELKTENFDRKHTTHHIFRVWKMKTQARLSVVVTKIDNENEKGFYYYQKSWWSVYLNCNQLAFLIKTQPHDIKANNIMILCVC